MSTYYDLVCREHGEKMGFHWNHGSEQLTALAHGLNGFIGMSPALLDLVDVEITFHCAEEFPQLGDIASFAKRHSGCTVLPKDEYGRWEDGCRSSAACPRCDHHGPCRLPEGHGGDCEPQP